MTATSTRSLAATARRLTTRSTAGIVALGLAVTLSGCASDGADASAPDAGSTQSETAPPTPPPSPVVPLPSIPITGTEPAAPQASVAPVRVQVPAVDIDVSVVPVGVQPDGLMELPEDVAVAGWYRYGPDARAEAGSTVVAAHVDSLKYGLGPFARLKGLAVGSEIVVTDESGAARTYLLESIENVLKAEIPLDRVFDRSGEPRLVLITCGGRFDQGTRTYSDNVLVTARPAGP